MESEFAGQHSIIILTHLEYNSSVDFRTFQIAIYRDQNFQNICLEPSNSKNFLRVLKQHNKK